MKENGNERLVENTDTYGSELVGKCVIVEEEGGAKW